MNTVEFFEIQANDIPKVKEFYGSLFGWKFEKQSGEPEYWRIETETIAGGLLQRPATFVADQGTNAFVCSIWVESFDTTAEQILAKGGTIALAKFAIPGRCWQGYFVDPDGNAFGIFEADENAQ